MKDQSGGAGPRRGFEYQDLAAAFFFLTDNPDFINKRPLELHIEQFGSDFAYFIRFDEYNEEHFFEVKYRQQGDLKLSEFYDVIKEFSKISREYSEEGNSAYFHLITNASFGKKLDTLFKDAVSLRRNTTSWSNIIDKKIYQRRNKNRLFEETGYDDDSDLYKLFRGLFGHRHSQEELKTDIENFVRRYNSPGNFRTPTKLILREINSRDSGVIRRDELEEVSDASLTVKSDSTSTQETSTSELSTQLKTLGQDISSKNVDFDNLHQTKETTVELTERMLSQEDMPTESVESQGVSLEEDLSKLIEIKEQEERLRYGIGKKSERFVDLFTDKSSDNEDGGEDL